MGKTGWILKKPDAKRRTFQLVPYQRLNGKKVYSSPIKHPELEALNTSLKSGTLEQHDAELQIKRKILPALRLAANGSANGSTDAVARSMIGDANLKAFEAFWATHYRRKKMERPSVAKDEFMTALRILEPLALHTASIDELQDHWNKKESGTRHKRYGNRINSLLKFLGRDVRIQTDRAVIPPLKWVSWSDLEKILEHVRDENLKDLYRTLYGTGARLGEMFAIASSDIKSNGTIFISKQIDRDKRLKRYTKNKKAHDTIILPEAMEAVKRWAAVDDKTSYRKRCQHPLISAAAKAFPNDPIKQIGPHKLRHSYVKQMLTLGVPLDRVAQFLGDTISATEANYRQWTVSDAEIKHVRDLMAAGYKRLKR